MAFHFSEPQFPHLQNGRENMYLRGPWGGVTRSHAPGVDPGRRRACGQGEALAVANGEWAQAAPGGGLGFWDLAPQLRS